MEDNRMICSHCGAIIEDEEQYETINGNPVCSDCVERYATYCDHCGAVIWTTDAYRDDSTTLCESCYNNYYTHCHNCGDLVHENDAYRIDGYDYCSECYSDEMDSSNSINEYGYKPTPIFYGNDRRYFGVELEIDEGGKDSDYADELLEIGNATNDHIYIKTDGSLDDGLEIVTHPMTLDYHKGFCWDEIMRKAIRLGYRSHQTSTCGLHIHVNRDSLGDSYEEQEAVISRILYFVEQHWNEMLKFSRRSEVSMNRWASRYGYESSPKAIMEKAKKGNCGRYAAVNLCNSHTIEFRLFRGTLKYNTLIAAIEIVNQICELAVSLSDFQMARLSWSEFVSGIKEPELIQYLKERNLYINEKIHFEEEV